MSIAAADDDDNDDDGTSIRCQSYFSTTTDAAQPQYVTVNQSDSHGHGEVTKDLRAVYRWFHWVDVCSAPANSQSSTTRSLSIVSTSNWSPAFNCRSKPSPTFREQLLLKWPRRIGYTVISRCSAYFTFNLVPWTHRWADFWTCGSYGTFLHSLAGHSQQKNWTY